MEICRIGCAEKRAQLFSSSRGFRAGSAGQTREVFLRASGRPQVVVKACELRWLEKGDVAHSWRAGLPTVATSRDGCLPPLG